MIPVADPFMQDAPVRRPGDFYRTVKGVPLVAHLTESIKDGSRPKRVMYRRPSGFGKQIENTYNLQKWGERQEALGFALDFNILKRATALLDGDRDSKEWRDEADSVVVAAKQAAKAWIAAERGTHTHGLAEDDDTDIDIIARIEHGETLGLDRTVQQALVEAWRRMLERNGLEIVAVEFACVNDHYKAAGTGDRVARLTRSLRFTLCTGELVELAAGTYIILDIKTGQYRRDNNGVAMYWQPYAIQVALYAGGCLYDPDTDERTPYPWPIDQDWAVIAHLDVLGAIDGNPSCELVLVDIAAGRAAADLCVAARVWENEATVFSVAQLDASGEPCGPGDAGSPSPDATDVEGAGAKYQVAPGSAPSTPVAGVAGSAVPTRPPATTDDGDPDGYLLARGVIKLDRPSEVIIREMRDGHAEALAWVSQPAVAPLVPLPTNPDEGGQMGDRWFRDIEVKYKALDAPNRAWISRLVSEAQHANVRFHASGNHTERRYWIVQGLVTLAEQQADDDVLRALVTAALQHDAFDPRHTVGACVGALNAVQAQRFAQLVDDYVGTTV